MEKYTYKGEDYHIVSETGGKANIVFGYRNLGHDVFEIIRILIYEGIPTNDSDVSVMTMSVFDVNAILDHRNVLIERGDDVE